MFARYLVVAAAAIGLMFGGTAAASAVPVDSGQGAIVLAASNGNLGKFSPPKSGNLGKATPKSNLGRVTPPDVRVPRDVCATCGARHGGVVSPNYCTNCIDKGLTPIRPGTRP
ncbi:hypothetical protein [Aldersonia kunmingensis]|uniref:hypothetical protein n=1 Tax=Aldersonia kunmingensis TaxID=408066 RepID=UPI000A81E725|nr:hypothetical protein [Aldersonia kunmingensis]